MPWCPKCKNEYVDGVKTCVDCGCDLVGSLEEMEKEGLIFGTQEEMEAKAGNYVLTKQRICMNYSFLRRKRAELPAIPAFSRRRKTFGKKRKR